MTAIDLPHGIADRADPGEPSRAARVQALLFAAVAPLLFGYLVLATAVALTTAWVPGSRFSVAAVFAAACPVWLAAHHVPLSIVGAPLGVLPLLPTVLLIGLIARTALRVARRLDLRTPTEARPLITVLVGTHAVVGLVLALVCSRGPLAVSASAAVLGCGAVSLVGAVIGLARRCALLDLLLDRCDLPVQRGFRAGLLGLLALLAGGLLVIAAGFVLSAGSSNGLFARTAPGLAGSFGLALLCVAYLPNAVVAVVSFLAGPGFSIGLVELNPSGMNTGPRLPLPLLAALPEHPAGWWPAFFALPAAAGVLVGWWARRTDQRPPARLRTVCVAAGVTAVGCFALAELAGGRLGADVFDPVRIPAGLLAVAAFCWIAVPGGVVAWLTGPRPRPEPAAVVTEQGPEDTEDDEPAAEDAADPDDTVSDPDADGADDAANELSEEPDPDELELELELDQLAEAEFEPSGSADPEPTEADPEPAETEARSGEAERPGRTE